MFILTGYARNLCDGILRTRFRHSLQKPEFLKPGEVCEVRINLVATSYLFRKDDRVRLEISSSNFPKFDRNPNTGQKGGSSGTVTRAVQTNLSQSKEIIPSHPTNYPERLKQMGESRNYRRPRNFAYFFQPDTLSRIVGIV